MRATGFIALLARTWVRVYTFNASVGARERRCLELESYLWEQREDARARGTGLANALLHALACLLRGMPDDFAWRRDETRGQRGGGTNGPANVQIRPPLITPSSTDPGGSDNPLGPFVQDVRFSLRGLRRDPWFTAVAVVCLALGIGANTAIFSVINGVVIRPLPYEDPGRLVSVQGYNLEDGPPAPGDPGGNVSYPNAIDWRQQADVFTDLAVLASDGYLMLGGDQPEQVRAEPVTPNFFSILGVPAAHGRALLPGETGRVIVLSDPLWRRAFGADPSVVGRSVRLDDDPFEIVGVMPPGFSLRRYVQAWTPIEDVVRSGRYTRSLNGLSAIGRLKPDATIEEAQAEMDVIMERLRDEYPEANSNQGAHVVPLHDMTVGNVRSTLIMLFAAVGILLLIACGNVTNLLLARTTARGHEVAVRAALGAGRWRIARQTLTESTILSLLGGVAGLGIAVWAVQLIQAMSPGNNIPRLDEVGIDGRVLAFTLFVSLATGWLFGSVPALQASRGNVAAALKGSGPKTSGSSPNSRLRNGLVVAEVAMALVLLLGAGLFINSFRFLWTFEPGFDPTGVLTVDIPSMRTKYPETVQQAAFVEQLYERLRGLPGVESVGGTGRIPLVSMDISFPITAEGIDSSDADISQFIRDRWGDSPIVMVSYRPVSGDYFEAMRVPVLEGRTFANNDVDAVVINEVLARRLWPDGGAVGRRIKRGPDDDSPWLHVIGVVAAQRYDGTDPYPRPEVFSPHGRSLVGARFDVTTVVVRTAGKPLDLAPAVREATYALDPDQPIRSVRTMQSLLDDSMARPRFYMALFSLFGAVALALAAVGIFGVASYSVAERTHEIGVRVALGARRADVLRLILGHGSMLAGLGIVLGLAGTFFLTRYVESLLYGIEPTDPATFVSVPLILGGVAMIAFYLPARHAARVDPLVALRRD